MKIVKDCIHSYIEIPNLCLSFMDTPEFQRLRRIKQLGMTSHVYPSGTHTRFEHCVGVMHLAGKVVQKISSYKEISERTKHLIQLAGLYHDIGHFAYSHLFDKFLSSQNIGIGEQCVDPIFSHKDHENRSLFILNQVNNRLKLLSRKEQRFVEDLIKGEYQNKENPYLYQIICNLECGLDVDKMDYLQRDAYHTGLPGFESDYIIHNCIIDNDGMLGFKEKARNDISDLYETRRRMHMNVYQHHTTQKINKIYWCIMKHLGNELFQFGSKTDDYMVESLIRSSSNPKIKELVRALDERNLDHCCENCQDCTLEPCVPNSGGIEMVKFY